jgi:hypothetical protein
MLIKEKKFKTQYTATILTSEAAAVILKSKMFAIFGCIKNYGTI